VEGVVGAEPDGRCTVERLMKALGLHGARRGRTMRTNRSDPAAPRPADLVERNFNRAGRTRFGWPTSAHVPTWAGFVDVALVIDAFSRRS
jgi:putative transposase